MENLIVVTFQNAQNATDGLNRVKELDELSDITIYNIALIRKTGESQFELLHRDGPDTADFPATGAVAGTLIGAIAGPVGMAIGMMTGTMFGYVDEDTTDGFYTDLMDKLKDRLSAGTFAIVMDVEEDSELIINSYMEPYNGVIVRTAITDMVDDYDQEQQADVLRNVQPGAPDRRFVGADSLDQKSRDRVDGHHQGRQHAVAAAETIVDQQ